MDYSQYQIEVNQSIVNAQQRYDDYVADIVRYGQSLIETPWGYESEYFEEAKEYALATQQHLEFWKGVYDTAIRLGLFKEAKDESE